MTGQTIRPIDDGIELEVEADDGTIYTVRFHCPPDGELDICANEDGTFDLNMVDSEGKAHGAKMDPSGGGKALGK